MIPAADDAECAHACLVTAVEGVPNPKDPSRINSQIRISGRTAAAAMLKERTCGRGLSPSFDSPAAEVVRQRINSLIIH